MSRRGFCTVGCGACCRVLALPVPAVDSVLVLEPERRGDGRLAYAPRPEVLASTWQHFLTTHGVRIEPGWLEVPLDGVDEPVVTYGRYGPEGQLVAYLRSTCAQLADDGTCRLYGRPERPAVCAEYPTLRDQLRGVPLVEQACTYELVEE